ncbi:MAG TPA: serine protease [Bacillus bacterium]|nr:serine protease [Bacillus sp. (in: firmicutes)]
MGRLISLLILSFIIYISWPFISDTEELSSVEDFKTEFQSLKDNPELSSALEAVNNGLNQIIGQLNSTKEQLTPNGQTDFPKVQKPDLETPAEQTFSIHNIEIGEAKNEVENHLGNPQRVSVNEYGTQWHAYHEGFQNFIMVSYGKDNKVNGLYTNQDLIASRNGISFGSSKETVRAEFGEPLTKIIKGLTHLQLQQGRDYDVYQQGGSYITIFYDKHSNNSVTAIQLISEQLEQNKSGFYTKASEPLKEGLELQLFDLTNASRVNNGLSILKWDDRVRETARKHSKDMAENEYFNHTNLEGKSPFDRMAEDDIVFAVAGENLAYGQFSSIFAHEGLMNSLGHRENILKPEFELLGVGVAFGNKSQPYFTENFYTKRM